MSIVNNTIILFINVLNNTMIFKQSKDTKKPNTGSGVDNLITLIDGICVNNDIHIINSIMKNLVEYVEQELPIFNLEYQKIINSVCDTFNSPKGFYIPSVLAAAAAAIGKNITIQDEKGTVEKAAVYMCIIGQSGTGKSPSINWCINPIKQIELENWEQYKLEKLEHEQNEQTFNKAFQTTYITDSTTEALTSRLNDSDGIIYLRDELIGWLKDMNKYRGGGGSDDLLYMQIWNSNDTIRVERQTKSITIDNPFLSVLGGTQPKRLNEFTKQAATDSGFFQRILFSYPGSKIQDRTTVKEDKQLKQLYSDKIKDIYKKCRGLEQKITIELSEKSNAYYTYFINNFIRKQQRLFQSNSLLVECLSKLETYVLRFTLIYEIMDNDTINWIDYCSEQSLKKAIATVIYFYWNTQKVINSSQINSLYSNDSDRIIHTILSSKFTQGEVFTTGQAVNLVGNRFSRQIVSKHLRETGKYLYENLSRGKYSLL